MKRSSPLVLATLLATAALLRPAAATAQACGDPPPLAPADAQSETIVIQQPPARSHVGFSAATRNGGRMVVTGVGEGSPADAAGFAVCDTILAVDGEDALERRVNVRRLEPGVRYVVRVRRGAEEHDLVLVPAPPRRGGADGTP